jgi:hypothetical protein
LRIASANVAVGWKDGVAATRLTVDPTRRPEAF